MRISAAFLAFSAGLWAQVNTASLTGVVKDPTDAAVVTAKVTATQTATNLSRSVVTDNLGGYFFALLPVGDYAITVEAPGFKKTTAAVTLETAQKGRQDFTLAVGSVDTTVTVEGTVSQLSPQDASIGSVVDSNLVNRYPLLLRSWDDLLATIPGVQGIRYTDQGGGTSFGRTGGFNVHGVRSLQNNFMLDGIDNNSISENVQELTSQVVRPSVDAIQEFKVTTNPYAAEYGALAGRRHQRHYQERHQPDSRRACTSTCATACWMPTTSTPTVPAWPNPRTCRTSSAATWAEPSSRTACSTSSITKAPASAAAFRA